MGGDGIGDETGQACTGEADRVLPVPVRARRRVAERDSIGRRMNDGWLTRAKRETFLAVLYETSNARGAARAAGANISAFHRLKERDPDFAAAWGRAIAYGHDALEGNMLAKARGTADPDDRTDTVLGMAMLKRLDGGSAGRAMGGRVSTQRVPITVVHDELLRRVAIVARRLEKGGRR